MPHMIPTNIELTKANKSEKTVYYALKAQLDSNVYVFYSMSWRTVEKGHHLQSECDFLIFDPRYGFLTCECKGGERIEVTPEKEWRIWDDPYSYRVLKRSPQEQSEESSRYFFNLFKETYHTNFTGVYGSCVIFPHYVIDNPDLLANSPKEIVLDKNDMPSLKAAIERVFRYYKGHRSVFITETLQDKFLSLVNERKAIAAAAGALIETKEKEFDTINRVQDGYVYLLKEHNQIMIEGGAGTGKTWIGMKIAVEHKEAGKKVLFVCYSDELAVYIKKTISETFLCKDIDVLSLKNLLLKDNKNPEYIDYSYMSFNEYQEPGFELYDSIIVDEAQDFDQNFAMIIRMHLKDDNLSSIYVFYDKTQNLYKKDFMDGFLIKEKPFYLHENLRNTASIYNYASSRTKLGTDVIANQIIGTIPKRSIFDNEFEMINMLEDTLNTLIEKEGVPASFITVIVSSDLYDKFMNKQISKWTLKHNSNRTFESIELAKTEDFKGMESNVVFYLHTDNSSGEFDYVSYTRAKYFLYDYALKTI